MRRMITATEDKVQKNETQKTLLFLDEPMDRATSRPHDKPDTHMDMKVP